MKDLIPGDDEAKKTFGDKALEEFKSNRFRLSFCVYYSLFSYCGTVAETNGRHMVIGRKPDVKLDLDQPKGKRRRV